MCKVLMLAMLFGVTLYVPTYGQQGPAQNIEWVKCPQCPVPQANPKEIERLKMSFGYFKVPENRKDTAGRSIRIALAVSKAQNEHTGRLPLVILHGGPGGHAVGRVSDQHLDLRSDRDIVFIDQRGAGASDPGFPGVMNQEMLQIMAADMSNGQEREARLRLARRVKNMIDSANFDISAYNSTEAARDIHEICMALGYPKYDIWGSSYGTRVALTLMRDFPGDINRVILESPLPANSHYLQETTVHFDTALTRYFKKCEEDNACRLAYPALKADFYQAISGLYKQPMMISMDDRSHFPEGKFVINGQDMLLGIQQMLYSRENYPIIPPLIEALKRRDESFMRTIIQGMVTGLFRLNYPVYYSVICRECMPFNSAAAFDSSSRSSWGGLSFYRDEFDICKIWNNAVPDRADSAAVVSDLPVMILSGELDPISSTAYDTLLLKDLYNAHAYVFSNTGHFSSQDPHALPMIRQFLDSGGQKSAVPTSVDTRPIGFITDLHVHAGIASLAPKLSFSSGNTGYLVWIGLCFAGLLTGIVLAMKFLRQRKTRTEGHSAVRFVGITACMGGIVALVFLVLLAGAILWTASHSRLTLGFGLPAQFAPILLLPYLIGLCYVALLASVAAGPASFRPFLLRWCLSQLPFVVFIYWFTLYYR